VQPEIAPIELDRMLGALRIEFATQARHAGLTLDIADTGLWVRSDFRMLRRILQNLLSNALRYTTAGMVGVSVTIVGGDARIAVRDTGRGIDPANFELIFEEFRRLAYERGPAGKGLGLAIVRRASLMLGHELEVSSKLGEGSEFAVIVPLTEALVAEPAAARRRQRTDSQAATGTVLIIDNEAAILTGMEALLGRWGYRVVMARTLGEAQEWARNDGPPALMIADYHLDDGQLGDEVVGALRGEFGANIPAMIISADRSEEVKARLAAAGLPMLNKPIKPAMLRSLMRTLLA